MDGDVVPYTEQIFNHSTQRFETITRQLDMTATFGDLANDQEFRSAMINMAYLAAAANGQTGRTLSDKDLALHLEQLGATFGGGGGIRTPEASVRAITSWYHNQLEATSLKMQGLERSSMASDWRRDNPNELTPWADQYISPQLEGKDNRTQKLFSLAQVFGNQGDTDWENYLSILTVAKFKFGKKAIGDHPINGIRWYEEWWLPYLEKRTDGSIDAPPGGGPNIVKRNQKDRTGVY